MVRTDLGEYFHKQKWSAYAHRAVQIEIEEGRLMKAGESGLSCVDCGKPAKHWEHRDYEKPLQIEPVCIGCNFRRGSAVYPSHLPPRLHVSAPRKRGRPLKAKSS
jgi:hypothetical protein